MCPNCGQSMPINTIAELPHLPPTQYRLLRILQSAGSTGVTTQAVYERLYANDDAPEIDNVKTHISRLRHALRPCGYNIESAWGYYRIVRIHNRWGNGERRVVRPKD